MNLSEVLFAAFVILASMASSMSSVIPGPTSSLSASTQFDDFIPSYGGGLLGDTDVIDDANPDDLDDPCSRLGQYFSSTRLSCVPCSTCPVNQIIRRPCSRLEDTVCGPFLEFTKFQQSAPAGSPDAVELGGSPLGQRHYQQGHRNKGWREENADDAGGFPEGSMGVSVSDMWGAVQQWRNLAIAVFCILAAVGVIVVVFVVFICHQRRRQHLMEKQLHREPVLIAPGMVLYEGEPRYVPFPVKMTSLTQGNLMTSSVHLYEELLGEDWEPMVSSEEAVTMEDNERERAGEEATHIYTQIVQDGSSHVILPV